jgi:thymidine phosphorylase
MEGVLGHTAGNAVEVAECIEVLSGRDRSSEVVLLTEWLGGILLVLTGRSPDIARGRDRIRDALASGRGLERFERWVKAQGGRGDANEILRSLPVAVTRTPVEAGSDGYVGRIAGREIGDLLARIGGGRLKMDDRIDPRVGVRVLLPTGSAVRKGEPVLEILYGRSAPPVSPESLGPLFEVVSEPPEQKPLIGGIVTERGFAADPAEATV